MIKGIELIKYADSFLGEDQIFLGGSKEKQRPIIFGIYLIKTENRLILVDAGCETMPGFCMKNFISPALALKQQQGIDSADITDVILTHAHHDHAAAVALFKNAVIHIQRDEYINAKKYIPQDMRVKIFDSEKTVAEGIIAVKIGGHTKGSCIVTAEFQGGLWVICGDECYSRENLLNKIPTGSSFNIQKSKEFVEKYSKPQYKTLLCHDL